MRKPTRSKQHDPKSRARDRRHRVARPTSRCFRRRRRPWSSTSCASACCAHTRQAIDDFAMVRPGERWLVALSGGKDSYGLLACCSTSNGAGCCRSSCIACNLDQGQPNFPKHILPEFLTRHGIAHRIEYQDTYSIVTDKIARGQHLLLALLAAAARPPLPHRAGGGLLGAGARPPPRGHSRDVLHEPVPWRPARRHAAEAAQRRGRRRGAAAADLLRRGRPREDSPRRWRSRSSPATSAAARRGCSATP